MSFDLVLTARDRKVETLRFLASLAAQQGVDEVRILFSDQGIHFTPLELASIPIKDGISLHTLAIEPSALSVARNEAIKKIGLSSAIVGFPDDDCWYGATVLSSVQRIFDERPDLQCVCTNVFDPDKNLTYGSRPVGIRLPITFSNIFSLPISVGIFIRRESFEKIGSNFNESLGAGTFFGSGEETELIARLLDSGARILYVGDISVFHPVPDYKISDAEKFYTYGLGYGYLATSFIKQGNYLVTLNWTSVMVRSLLGSLAYLFKGEKRSVYWRRFIGILDGSWFALRRTSTHIKS